MKFDADSSKGMNEANLHPSHLRSSNLVGRSRQTGLARTVEFSKIDRSEPKRGELRFSKINTKHSSYTMRIEKYGFKTLLYISLAFCATWIGILTWSHREVQNPGALKQDDKQDDKQDMSTTGSAAVNIPSQASQEVIRINTLDVSLLPGASSAHSEHKDRSKRLIFIGDIHGCINELHELLEKADYDGTYDHIVTTGDMINKGPNSRAVVDFLLSKRASCVRGNHDHKILRLVDEISTDDENVVVINDREHNLARALTSEQLTYLRSCPVILKVGKIAERNLVVVHGGLVPSLALDEQDSYHVMNMRILESSTHQPSKDHEKPGFKPWTDIWHDYQLRPAAQDGVVDRTLRPAGSSVTTVIYGHDAKAGLQIKQFSKGLDSACVKGKKLTAFTVDAQGVEELIQVECRDYTH